MFNIWRLQFHLRALSESWSFAIIPAREERDDHPNNNNDPREQQHDDSSLHQALVAGLRCRTDTERCCTRRDQSEACRDEKMERNDHHPFTPGTPRATTAPVVSSAFMSQLPFSRDHFRKWEGAYASCRTPEVASSSGERPIFDMMAADSTFPFPSAKAAPTIRSVQNAKRYAQPRSPGRPWRVRI